MGKPTEPAYERTPEEIARIRDDALTRLMAMPPKQHKDMKLGKPRGKKLHEPHLADRTKNDEDRKVR